MWMVIAAVLAILLAAGAGFLTWRLTTGKTGKGSAGRKVHISRKGAYVDDGNLGGKSGELFRGTLWDDDGTVMTEQGYGWGTGQERGRREISLKSEFFQRNSSGERSRGKNRQSGDFIGFSFGFQAALQDIAQKFQHICRRPEIILWNVYKWKKDNGGDRTSRWRYASAWI